MGIHEDRMRKIQQDENKKKVQANQIEKGEKVMTSSPHINQAQFFAQDVKDWEIPEVNIAENTVLVATHLIDPYMAISGNNAVPARKSADNMKIDAGQSISALHAVVKTNLIESVFDFKIGDLLYLKSGMIPSRTFDLNGVSYHLIEAYQIACQLDDKVEEYKRYYDSIRRRAAQILENFKKESKPKSSIYVGNNVVGEA